MVNNHKTKTKKISNIQKTRANIQKIGANIQNKV